MAFAPIELNQRCPLKTAKLKQARFFLVFLYEKGFVMYFEINQNFEILFNSICCSGQRTQN